MRIIQDLTKNKKSKPSASSGNFGIKYRLFLSFGAVFAMTLASIAVGWIVLGNTSNTLNDITSKRVPEVTASLELSVVVSQLTAQAPLLAASSSESEEWATWALLTAELEKVDAILAEGQLSEETQTEIKAKKAEIIAILEKLKVSVNRQLSLQQTQAQSLKTLEENVRKVERSLIPIIQKASDDLYSGLGEVSSQGTDVIGQYLETSLDPLISSLEIEAHTAGIGVVVTAAANEPLPAKLDLYKADYEEVMSAIDEFLVIIKDRPGQDKVRDAVMQIKEVSEGENNVFKTRLAVLNETVQKTILLANARQLAQEFSSDMQALVTDAREKMNADNNVAKEEAANGETLLLSIALISFIVSLLISVLYVGRSLVNRLVRLSDSMQLLAEGNMNVEIDVAGNDEITGMARTVGVFRESAMQNEQLQKEAEENRKAEEETRQRRQEQEQQRETSAAEERRRLEVQAEEEKQQALTQIANNFEAKVGGVIGNVSSASQQMNSNAQKMSMTAQQSTQQSEAVMSASDSASNNVNAVSAATEELSASIQEIKRQVLQSAEIAKRADNEADSTNVTVKGLANAADRIGEVVSLISDIANQTNLLALNATIEAARAGEAGKGFAVVASEVKNLATQTAKATEEITVQISGMQGATGEAVSAIEGIGRTISEINEVANNIANSVEEQGAATDEIARNIQLAASGTSDVNHSIAEVSRASAETGNVASDVLSASTVLTEQANTLGAEVDEFLREVRAM
jgi:methyl-accepting chemotaxis protein